MTDYVSTSENILVRLTPGTPESHSFVFTTHSQFFAFHSVSNAATFKLWVNGKVTGNITYSTTPATTATNIKTALDALTGLVWNIVSSSGTVNTLIVMECATSARWFHIKIDTQPSTGGIARTYVRYPGKQVYIPNSALKSVANQGNIEFTDVSPVMQREEVSLPTKEVLTCVLDFYDIFDPASPNDSLEYVLFPGQTVLLEVYENGNITGQRMYSFYLMIEDVQRSGSSQAVKELRVSGRRQGAMIKPFGTII